MSDSDTPITPPERARCAKCGVTVHGAEHLHRDPALRRSDEILWVCEPCFDYLDAALDDDARIDRLARKPAPATPLLLGMRRNGGPRL